MQDDEFEWDDDKAARNQLDHGVTFVTARLAFDDAAGLDGDEDSQDYGEDRYWRIGMAGDHLVYVAYTIRRGRTRIISARKTEGYERRMYHEEKGD